MGQVRAKHWAGPLALGAGLLAAGPALSEASCGPRAMVLAALADRFGESRRGYGLAGEAAVMEVFASDETGTWTITITTPDGVTCLAASGVGFETLAESLPPPGDPA
jgi:hypothetical protein